MPSAAARSWTRRAAAPAAAPAPAPASRLRPRSRPPRSRSRPARPCARELRPRNGNERPGFTPMKRFVFITGGVVSSLGKGLAAAALGSLLQLRGYRVRLRKLDPYLNVDPGTMSPYQHGEVFVTDDGAETDLDLGPLRALHRRARARLGHGVGRPDLLDGADARAPWRLSRRHRAGDPARHQRHQGVHRERHRGGRHRPVRDRRHGRRHRGPAVLRGDPPVRARARAAAVLLHPRHAGAVDPLGAGAQDQAHPAFGGGTAGDRHPARHPARAGPTGQSPRTRGARSPCSARCGQRR